MKKKKIFETYYNTLTKHQKKIFLLMVDSKGELSCNLTGISSFKHNDGTIETIRKDTVRKLIQPELKYVWRDILI